MLKNIRALRYRNSLLLTRINGNTQQTRTINVFNCVPRLGETVPPLSNPHLKDWQSQPSRRQPSRRLLETHTSHKIRIFQRPANIAWYCLFEYDSIGSSVVACIFIFPGTHNPYMSPLYFEENMGGISIKRHTE